MDKSKTPIFDRMAEDLSQRRPEYRDEILCPLCLGRFGRPAMRSLTKEHVLSKSLGGRAVTLTCKPCNNFGGQKIQSHLNTLLKVNEGFRGGGKLRGRFTIFEQTVPVAVQVKPGAGLAIDALGGSPDTMAAIHQGFRGHGPGRWAMSLNLAYNPGKASAAIARAAYLAAFERFGYGYILCEPVDLFRRELVSAMDVHSERLCLVTGKLGSASVPDANAPEAVIIPVTMNEQFRFLVAVMRFQHSADYWMFCGLPVKDEAAESMFESLGYAVQQLGAFNLNMNMDENGEIDAQFVPQGQNGRQEDESGKEVVREGDGPDG